MEGVEWLRELEQETKNAMTKVNLKARAEALRRARSDLSVHKWAETRIPGEVPTVSTTTRRRRKRPLTPGDAVVADEDPEIPTVASGTRILLTEDSIGDFLHEQHGQSEAARTKLLPPDALDRLPGVLAARANQNKPGSLSNGGYFRGDSAPSLRYDPLPSMQTVALAIEQRRQNSAARRASEASPNGLGATTVPTSPLRGRSRGSQRQAANACKSAGSVAGGLGSSTLPPAAQPTDATGLNATRPAVAASTLPSNAEGTLPRPRRPRQASAPPVPAMGLTTKEAYLGVEPPDSTAEAEAKARLDPDYVNFYVPLVGDTLRVRYRDLPPREQQWAEDQAAVAAARDLARDEGTMVTVEVRERHPLPRWVAEIVATLNADCRKLIRGRNRLKKYVLDVEAAWRANLPHLREHSTFDTQSGLCSGRGGRAGAEEAERQMQRKKERRAQRLGLDGGRDSEGISEGSAQVQSVALSRALEGAYFTPEPPREPLPSPANSDPTTLQPPLLTAPLLFQLASNFMLPHATNADGYGGARYLGSVARLKRPHDLDPPRWRISCYDRYSGLTRAVVLPESEALHLAKLMAPRLLELPPLPASRLMADAQWYAALPDYQQPLADEPTWPLRIGDGNGDVRDAGGSRSRRSSYGGDRNDDNEGGGGDSVGSGSPGGEGGSVGESVWSSVTSFTAGSTLNFEDTGALALLDESTVELDDDAIGEGAAAREYLAGDLYRGDHAEAAAVLARLAVDPDLEPWATREGGILTLWGLDELRTLRSDAAQAAAEAAAARAREEEAAALAANAALREATFQQREREAMASEEKATKLMLAEIAAAAEAKSMYATAAEFFLLCDRTARGTVRRKDFISVLHDEPELADALRCWHALPFQSLPEEDREHVEGIGEPLSPALLGMVFDAIDESAGYTVGEIKLETTQSFLLQHAGTCQLHHLDDAAAAEVARLEAEEAAAKEAALAAAAAAIPVDENGDEILLGHCKRPSLEELRAAEAQARADAKAKRITDMRARAASKWAEDDARGGVGWEEEADAFESVPCLSMRVSDAGGGAARARTVPGICPVGRPGLWWTHPVERERTYACGVYFRDTRAIMTSTPTVVVNLLLALDTPCLAPRQTTWNGESRPAASPLDLPHAPMPPPFLMPLGQSLRKASPATPYDTLMSATCVVQTDAAMPLDFAAVRMNLGKGQSEEDPHRRTWPVFNARRFRQRLPTAYSLFPVWDTIVWKYAISKGAVSANAPALCGRHTWHSEQRCVEQLGRKRGAKDLYDCLEFVKAHTDGGLNEATTFVSHLDGPSLMALETWRFSAFEQLYEEIRELKAQAARDEALQAKIESAEAEIAAEGAAKKARAAGGGGVGRAPRMNRRGKVRAEFGMKAWEARLQRSTLLATDEVGTCGAPGQWQKWMDTSPSGQGVTFFVDRGELSPMPFQWDAPPGWDPKSLLTVTANAKAAAEAQDRELARRKKQAELDALKARQDAAIAAAKAADPFGRADPAVLAELMAANAHELELHGHQPDGNSDGSGNESSSRGGDGAGASPVLLLGDGATEGVDGSAAVEANPSALLSPGPSAETLTGVSANSGGGAAAAAAAGAGGDIDIESFPPPALPLPVQPPTKEEEEAFALLAPGPRALARAATRRRALCFHLCSSPAFVAAVTRKLEAARSVLRADVRQRGEDVGEDASVEEGRELHSDEDPWSDSDDEAGDWEGEPDFMPQSYGDQRRRKMAARQVDAMRETKAGGRIRRDGRKNKPTVPEINLPPALPSIHGGVGQHSVPRLLRPGVTIRKEPTLALPPPPGNAFVAAANSNGQLSSLPQQLEAGSVSPTEATPAMSAAEGGGVASSSSSSSDLEGARARAEPRQVARWRDLAPPGRALAPHMHGLGWRVLPRADIAPRFAARLETTHTVPGKHSPPSLMRPPNLSGFWDLREETGYQPPSFEKPYQTMMVSGTPKEGLNGELIFRAAREKRRETLSELMSKPLPIRELTLIRRADGDAATEFTNLDRLVADLAEQPPVPAEERFRQARVMVTANNLADLDALFEECEEAHEDVHFPSMLDEFGRSLLMIACQQGFKRVAKFLLRKHFDINAANYAGNTPLHFAFEYSHQDLAQYLIDHGANKTAVNAEGCTPYEGLTQKKVSEV